MVRTIQRVVHHRHTAAQGGPVPGRQHTPGSSSRLPSLPSSSSPSAAAGAVRGRLFRCEPDTGVEAVHRRQCGVETDNSGGWGAPPSHVPFRPPAAPRVRFTPLVAPPVRVARSSDRRCRKPCPKPRPPPGSGAEALPRSGYFPRRPRPPRRAMPKPRMRPGGGETTQLDGPASTHTALPSLASCAAPPWPQLRSQCTRPVLLAGMRAARAPPPLRCSPCHPAPGTTAALPLQPVGHPHVHVSAGAAGWWRARRLPVRAAPRCPLWQSGRVSCCWRTNTLQGRRPCRPPA